MTEEQETEQTNFVMWATVEACGKLTMPLAKKANKRFGDGGAISYAIGMVMGFMRTAALQAVFLGMSREALIELAGIMYDEQQQRREK